jgi:long-subunit fatty acid transport protein
MQIKERLFLGTNINLHYVEQRRFQTFNENHANQTNASQSLINTSFFTDLFTQGNGFSMQLGAIYKITPDLRGGLSYESPTWFTFNESIYQSVRSNYFDFNDNIAKAAFVDTDEIILPEYNLRTPGKITGSLAYLIGEKGLINLDYGYKDFTQMRFSADGANYNDMNDVIKNTFTASHDVRIGGEYRYKMFSFRGGYRLETTPYKNNDIMGNLTAYSGGLGYNFGNTKVDMAFSTMQRESKQKFFEAANISAPTLTNRLNNLTLTVLFEL